MANADWDAAPNSRIWNNATDWTPQADENQPVTSGIIGDSFIIGFSIWSGVGYPACNKTYNTASFKLQWEASDSPDVWTDVGVDTEISWGSDDAIIDNGTDAVDHGLTDPSGGACGNLFGGSNYNKEDNSLDNVVISLSYIFCNLSNISTSAASLSCSIFKSRNSLSASKTSCCITT